MSRSYAESRVHHYQALKEHALVDVWQAVIRAFDLEDELKTADF